MSSGLRLLVEDEVLQSVARSVWSEELGGSLAALVPDEWETRQVET